MKKKHILFTALLLIGLGAFVYAGTVTKGLIGKQDIYTWYTVSSESTFQRDASTGHVLTLNAVDWMGIDILQVYGGGTRQTGVTISDAMTAIGTAPVRDLFLAHGTWTIATSLNIGTYTNAFLVIPPGTMISVDSGKTLTLPSPRNIIAGPYQIFTGSGTVAFTNRTGWGHAKWFADLPTAITTGIDLLLDGESYALATASTLTTGQVLQGQGPERTTIASTVAGIALTAATDACQIRDLEVDCADSTSSVGILVSSGARNVLHNVKVDNAYKGIKLYGTNTTASLYNKGTGVVYLSNCSTGLEFAAATNDDCNYNHFDSVIVYNAGCAVTIGETAQCNYNTIDHFAYSTVSDDVILSNGVGFSIGNWKGAW